MSYVPYPKGTYLVPSGPKGNQLHLFVVMTNPCPDKMHLLLSLCSVRPKMKYDDSCVFNGGEHPFIKRLTYVLYRHPFQYSVALIQKQVAKGIYVVRDDMADHPFSKMCAGIYKSRFIQPWAIDYFHRNCVQPEKSKSP